MLGFVVVSHSKRLAEEIIILCNEMKKYDFPVINGSGMENKSLGTDPLIIKKAIEEAYLKDSVMIFADLGSSIFNSEIALEFLDGDKYNKELIRIADAPIVEGVLMSMAINDEKLVLCELEEELKELKNMKKV